MRRAHNPGSIWISCSFCIVFPACLSAMTGSPGPTTDQETLQEEFLGALEALGGSAGNGRLGSC